MLKFFIVLTLIALVASLASSFFFLMKDDSRRHRVVNSLILRVSLSALLLILIAVGIMTGTLALNPRPY